MSWAAHDLEPYAFQRHLKLKLAFVPLLIGSYSPDMMTKWFVYGIRLGPWELKASDPAQFHRGWPGFGFTHSFVYGVVIALIFWKVFDSKLWGISFLVGQWALFVWLRFIVGLVFPLIVSWAAVQTARSRSMEAATGLLYINVGSIAAGTILAAGLYFGAGLLV